MTIVQWLLLPAFIHVAWVYRASRVRMGGREAARGARWPREARATWRSTIRAGRMSIRKLDNNYNNQFELPVLLLRHPAADAHAGEGGLAAGGAGLGLRRQPHRAQPHPHGRQRRDAALAGLPDRLRHRRRSCGCGSASAST